MPIIISEEQLIVRIREALTPSGLNLWHCPKDIDAHAALGDWYIASAFREDERGVKSTHVELHWLGTVLGVIRSDEIVHDRSPEALKACFDGARARCASIGG